MLFFELIKCIILELKCLYEPKIGLILHLVMVLASLS